MFTRRRFALLAALAPAAAFLSSFALAGCGAQDKAEIEKAYAGMDQALNAKDATKLLSYYADDFSTKGPGGQTVTKAQAQQGLQMGFGMMTSVHQKSTVESVEVSGSTATASVKTHSEVTIKLPMAPKESKVVADGTVKDTWTKAAGGWRLKGRENTSTSATIDGKSVPVPANLGF